MTASLLAAPRAGDYRVIWADPPWHHASRSSKGQTRRSPSHHYATMPLTDICALPVREVAAKDAHLFLWTTGPHLEQAFGVIRAWGFKYSAVAFTWAKLNPRAADSLFLTEADWHTGMGYTTRKNTEMCLLGRRGAPRRQSKGVRELIIAARRQHSRKPDEVRRRIEAYAHGPYLEMFARESAPGWDAWGLQVGLFNNQQSSGIKNDGAVQHELSSAAVHEVSAHPV